MRFNACADHPRPDLCNDNAVANAASWPLVPHAMRDNNKVPPSSLPPMPASSAFRMFEKFFLASAAKINRTLMTVPVAQAATNVYRSLVESRYNYYLELLIYFLRTYFNPTDLGICHIGDLDMLNPILMSKIV